MLVESLIAGITSLLITAIAVPQFTKFGKQYGIVGKDFMRPEHPEIPELGGPPVLIGFILGLLTFNILTRSFSAEINAAIGVATLTVFVGLFDTITNLGKKTIKEGFQKKMGYPKWLQPLAFLIAAVPLSVYAINRGDMLIPIIGHINVGLLFPLVIIPIGISGAANATNIFAGFDGLQAGMGIIVLAYQGLFAWLYGNQIATAVSIAFIGSLLAFLYYNWYPSRIFPGSLDYLVGAMIATVAILGNIIFFSVLCFVPWFIELILHLRSGLKSENYGVLQKDGSVKPKYKKNYSILHIIMRLGRLHPEAVSSVSIAIVLVWGFIAFLLSTWYYSVM